MLRQSFAIKTNETNPITAMAATSRLPVSSLTIQPETVQKKDPCAANPAADHDPLFTNTSEYEFVEGKRELPIFLRLPARAVT
jgi:hypothetical protein